MVPVILCHNTQCIVPTVYRAMYPQTSQGPHANPCSPLKETTAGTQASQLDLGSMDDHLACHYLTGEVMVPGCTGGRSQAGGWCMMLWQRSAQKASVSVFVSMSIWHVPQTETLLRSRYTPLWQWYSLTAILVRYQALLHCTHCLGMVCGTWQKVQGLAQASKFPRSQFELATLGWSGTSLKSGLTESAAKVSVPDTTGYIQKSWRVHVSANCFGGTRRTSSTLGMVRMFWLIALC